MNIPHATTDPNLLERLKQMLGSSDRADVGTGHMHVLVGRGRVPNVYH